MCVLVPSGNFGLVSSCESWTGSPLIFGVRPKGRWGCHSQRGQGPSWGIIDECGALLQGVIGANAPVEGQGDKAPSEGDAASSTHERKSAGSVMD